MKKNNPKTFCILPWTHSFVNSNGAYQLCCTSEEYLKGIPDKNGEFFNIKNRPDLNEVMNSDFMKNLRLEMISGKWNQACTRCLETERLGGVSRRIIENREFEDKIEMIMSSTGTDGEINLEFKSLDYRLGNLCNLQCRMCGPFSSEKWLKDWNQVLPENEHLNENQIKFYQGFNWIKDDYLLTELRQKLFQVEKIHFAGGEPLISPQMGKILKECINLGLAKKISISYNTNITILPLDVLDLWKEFKEVKLLCSIDGFSEVNDYIRNPSVWSEIDKNLTYLDDHAAELKITEILLSCTVQIYNVMGLKDLYKYLNKFKNIIPALNLINLNFPEYLSSQVLPFEAKTIARERLNQIILDLDGRLPVKYNYLIENILQVINFMDEKDHSDLLTKFKKFNQKYDEKKKMKLSQSIPELNKVLIDFYFQKIDSLAGL